MKRHFKGDYGGKIRTIRNATIALRKCEIVRRMLGFSGSYRWDISVKVGKVAASIVDDERRHLSTLVVSINRTWTKEVLYRGISIVGGCFIAEAIKLHLDLPNEGAFRVKALAWEWSSKAFMKTGAIVQYAGHWQIADSIFEAHAKALKYWESSLGIHS